MRLSILAYCDDGRYWPAMLETIAAASADWPDFELLLPRRAAFEGAASPSPLPLRFIDGVGDATPGACHAALAEAAAGEYLMTLDQAVFPLPGDLGAVCDFLDARPAVAAAYGRKFIGAGLEPEQPVSVGGRFSRFDAFHRFPFQRGGMILRRAAVLAAGNFRDHPGGMDADLYARLLLEADFAFDPAFRVCSRIDLDGFDPVEEPTAIQETAIARAPELYRELWSGRPFRCAAAQRRWLGFFCGIACFREPDPTRRLYFAETALQLEPDDFGAVRERIGALRELGRPADALAVCFDALLRFDGSAEARLLLTDSGRAICRDLGVPAGHLDDACRAAERSFFALPPAAGAVCAQILRALPAPELQPAFAGNNNIALACSMDDKFAPYGAVAIASILEHASAGNHYDIIILHDGLAARHRRLLSGLAAGRRNCRIRFRYTGRQFQLYGAQHFSLHGYFSRAVYYRLFLPELLPAYDRILYLDADIVVLHDVAELYGLELGDCLLGAARDFGMQIKVRRYPAFAEYMRETLKLKRPDDYFLSGVLLMDLKRCREERMTAAWIDHLKRIGNPAFPDQDVLNVGAEGRVRFFEAEWNALWFMEDEYADLTFDPACLAEYERSQHSYKLLHYCSGIKPWNFPDRPKAEHFWHYAEKTPYLQFLKDSIQYHRKL